jgi:hypothetical protein
MKSIDHLIEYANLILQGQYCSDEGYLKVPRIAHTLDTIRQLHAWGFAEREHRDIWIAAICNSMIGVGSSPSHVDTILSKVEELSKVEGSLDAIPLAITKELLFVDYEGVTEEDYYASFMDKSLHSLVIKIADCLSEVATLMVLDGPDAAEYFKKAQPLFEAYSRRLDELREEFNDTMALDIGRSISTFSHAFSSGGINLTNEADS